MKPAAPVTSSFTPGPPGSRAGPTCHSGRWIASCHWVPSTEYAGRGAGRANSAVVVDSTRQSTPASSKMAIAKSYQLHSPCADMWCSP